MAFDPVIVSATDGPLPQTVEQLKALKAQGATSVDVVISNTQRSTTRSCWSSSSSRSGTWPSRTGSPSGRSHAGSPADPASTARRPDLVSSQGGVTAERSARSVPPFRVLRPYIADMADIILGLLAILAGAFMLIAGRVVLRIALPIWGFFAGFAFGAGLVAEFADERFLGTVLGWVLGLVFALVFMLLAYLYFAVAVVLAFAAFGYAIGSGLVVALGIDWNWVAVLIGVAIGAVLGLVAVSATCR